MVGGAGRGVPGVWDGGWVPGGLYRVLPTQSPGSHIQPYLALRPYPRPNEGLFGYFHEVSQIGSRKGSRNGLRMTSNDPPDMTLQTGPEMASDTQYPDLRYPMV